MSNFLKDTILEYAKDTLSNPNYNPVNVLGGLLARQPQQTEQTNWDILTVPPDSNYVLIENGVRAKHIPSYFRIFGKFKFFVKVEIVRRAGLTDSALIVSAFQRRDLKNPLVCTTKWMHLTAAQERFTLNIPSNFYECSPRDIGRCVEVRITSSEPGFAGDCMILYGPIQLPIGTAERLKLAAEAGVVEIQCQVQPWKNGPIYQSLRISPRQIIAIPYRGALFLEQEAQLVALPILVSTYSVPSMKDPCAFRIKSNQEDIKVIAYNQDDRDLIIMFLQYQVKLKRKNEGRDPLKYDPSINEQQDVEEIIKRRPLATEEPYDNPKETANNKSYADLFYGAPNQDYSRHTDRDSFRDSLAHCKSYRTELNDTIGNTTKNLDQTHSHDNSKVPRGSQRILVLGSPEHMDDIRKLKGNVDTEPASEKPKLNRAPSFLTKGANVFTTILNTYLQDPKNKSTVTDLMSGWIGMNNSSKITETAQKYIEQNPEAGKELIQQIYSLKQTPPPPNIDTVDERDLELLKKPDRHVGHALLGLLKRVKTQHLSTPGVANPEEQVDSPQVGLPEVVSPEANNTKDQQEEPKVLKKPKSIKSDFIEPQQIDTDEEPAESESKPSKIKTMDKRVADTAKVAMNYSNKYLNELEELKLGIPWLENVLKLRKAIEMGKDFVESPEALDPKDLDKFKNLLEANNLSKRLSSKDPTGIGKGGQVTAPNSWGSLLDEPKELKAREPAGRSIKLAPKLVASVNDDPNQTQIAEKAKAAFESFAEVAKHYGKSIRPTDFYKIASSFLAIEVPPKATSAEPQGYTAPRAVESMLEESAASPPVQVPLLHNTPGLLTSLGDLFKSAQEQLSPTFAGAKTAVSGIASSVKLDSIALPFSNLMQPTIVSEPDAESTKRGSEGTQTAKNTLPSSFGSLGGAASTLDEGTTQLKRLEIQGILSASEVDNILKLQKTARGTANNKSVASNQIASNNVDKVKGPDLIEYENLKSEKKELVLLVAELRSQVEELEDRLDVIVGLEGFAKTKIELAHTEILQLKARLSAQERQSINEKEQMTKKVDDLQEELKRTREELNLSRMRDSQRLSGTQSRIFLTDESTQIGSLASRLRSKYPLECPTLPTEAELAESVEKLLDSYQTHIKTLSSAQNATPSAPSYLQAEDNTSNLNSLAPTQKQPITESAEIEALKQSLEVLKLEKDQNSRALLERIQELQSQLVEQSTANNQTWHAKLDKALRDKLHLEAELLRASKDLQTARHTISLLQASQQRDGPTDAHEGSGQEQRSAQSLQTQLEAQANEIAELRRAKDVLMQQLLRGGRL